MKAGYTRVFRGDYAPLTQYMQSNIKIDEALAIAVFQKYLRRRGLGEVSIRTYISNMRGLARAYQSEFGHSPTPQDLASTFVELVDLKIIDPYNPRRMSPIKHYFAAHDLCYPLKKLEGELHEFGKWLVSEGYTKTTAKTYRYGLRKHLRKLGLIGLSPAMFDFRNTPQSHQRAVALYAKFAELTGRIENDPLSPYPWNEHEAFKEWLASRYSPQTVNSYIRHYRDVVTDSGGSITNDEIQAYIQSLDYKRSWLEAQQKAAARRFLEFRTESNSSPGAADQ